MNPNKKDKNKTIGFYLNYMLLKKYLLIKSAVWLIRF